MTTEVKPHSYRHCSGPPDSRGSTCTTSWQGGVSSIMPTAPRKDGNVSTSSFEIPQRHPMHLLCPEFRLWPIWHPSAHSKVEGNLGEMFFLHPLRQVERTDTRGSDNNCVCPLLPPSPDMPSVGSRRRVAFLMCMSLGSKRHSCTDIFFYSYNQPSFLPLW